MFRLDFFSKVDVENVHMFTEPLAGLDLPAMEEQTYDENDQTVGA